MKYLAFFAVILLSVNLSLQLPELVNCTADYQPPDEVTNSCGIFTCDGPDEITGLGCPTYACSTDNPVQYINPDNSKPYPECCGEPVCEE